MKALIFVLLSLFNFTVLAVEMNQEEYQATITDISTLFRTGDTDKLRFLRTEMDRDILRLSPENARQGNLMLRLPLKRNHIRILQVPHAFFDLHTREIGTNWFESSEDTIPRPDIIMFNSEHRHETENSDMSRITLSLFTAVTEAFIEMQKSVRIIQIHAFNPNRRKSDSGADSDIILSSGTLFPNPGMLTMQSCLRDNGGLLARSYGRDVFELGATINPVGRLINGATNHQVSFLHIELSTLTRKALIAQDIPNEAIRCLLD